MSVNLTNSSYCSGVQCPKILWLCKNKPEFFDGSAFNKSVFEIKNDISHLALGLFGEYTKISSDGEKASAVETQKLMKEEVPVIAGAAFNYNRSFCRVDLLRNLGGGAVEIYAVKTTSTVKPIYHSDAAFQCSVLTKLGYRVHKVGIIHINTHYLRQGKVDIQKLFKTDDVTEESFKRMPEVGANIRKFCSYMGLNPEPKSKIGMHCITPYSCGFFGYCTKNLQKPNVFDVHGVSASTKFKCYETGVTSYEALSTSNLLTCAQKMQVEHELYGLLPHIEKEPIKEFLDTLSYPLYFLDFESSQTALPLFDGTKPFEPILFQYSLHYIEHEGGALEHREFLAYPDEDPRRALAEQLCRDIPKDVCTTAYNMSFEKSRIKELAALFPDLAEHLMNIHDNIHDLMLPFEKKHYYNRAMQGSYSIKHILPALFPDDPALDYGNLEEIQNGAEAAEAFQYMASLSGERLSAFRKNLLKYCGLDTFAMVKIWEELNRAVGNELKITW